MQIFSAEIHYQDINGNPQSKRFRKIKAADVHVAINKCHDKVSKLKKFMKVVGGDLEVIS